MQGLSACFRRGRDASTSHTTCRRTCPRVGQLYMISAALCVQPAFSDSIMSVQPSGQYASQFLSHWCYAFSATHHIDVVNTLKRPAVVRDGSINTPSLELFPGRLATRFPPIFAPTVNLREDGRKVSLEMNYWIIVSRLVGMPCPETLRVWRT